MRVALIALVLLLLTGCSVQVTGMQSPVLHDYGSIDWIPVDQRMTQLFIAGPGYSDTIDNDPATTPDEYLRRNAELPADARNGDLDRLRVGLRLAGREETGWDTGARIQLVLTESDSGGPVQSAQPVVDVEVDHLQRVDDRVILTDLPRIEPGSVLAMVVIPGQGPDSGRLEVGFTPHRAPYGGWRVVSGDTALSGALVFDTRYERDVAVGEVVREGVERFSDAGAAFLVVYGLCMVGLVTAVVYLARPLAVRARRGR